MLHPIVNDLQKGLSVWFTAFRDIRLINIIHIIIIFVLLGTLLISISVFFYWLVDYLIHWIFKPNEQLNNIVTFMDKSGYEIKDFFKIWLYRMSFILVVSTSASISILFFDYISDKIESKLGIAPPNQYTRVRNKTLWKIGEEFQLLILTMGLASAITLLFFMLPVHLKWVSNILGIIALVFTYSVGFFSIFLLKREYCYANVCKLSLTNFFSFWIFGLIASIPAIIVFYFLNIAQLPIWSLIIILVVISFWSVPTVLAAIHLGPHLIKEKQISIAGGPIWFSGVFIFAIVLGVFVLFMTKVAHVERSKLQLSKCQYEIIKIESSFADTVKNVGDKISEIKKNENKNTLESIIDTMQDSVKLGSDIVNMEHYADITFRITNPGPKYNVEFENIEIKFILSESQPATVTLPPQQIAVGETKDIVFHVELSISNTLSGLLTSLQKQKLDYEFEIKASYDIWGMPLYFLFSSKQM